MRTAARTVFIVRHALFAAMLGFVTATAGAATTAAAEEFTRELDFNIPSQRLADAILQFSEQAGVQVVTLGSNVSGLKSQGVSGKHRIDEALHLMLKGTGLTFNAIGGNTVSLVHSSSVVSSSEEGMSQQADGLHLAQSSMRQDDQGNLQDHLKSADQRSEASQEQDLQEIIVTAQKRAERLIDVPISIVAVSGEELRKRQATSLDDLPYVVPGLAIFQNGIGRSLELRGVRNNVGNSASVGTYVDEASVTLSSFATMDLNLYDLERVEVLRGPQGTLYGDGSAGGTIRLITKDPVLNRFGMSSDIAATFTERGAPGQRVNLMLNAPVVSNTFGLRMAGTFAHDGGWIDQPAAGREDINGQDLTNVRVKGLWKPGSQFTATVTAQIYRNNRSTGVGEDDQGNYTQVFDLTTAPRTRQDNDLLNLTLAYDFSSARLLSSTSYLTSDFDTKDFGDVSPLAPPAPPTQLYAPLYQFEDRAWVQELRLTSTGSGPWQWTAGVFYRDFRDETHWQFNIGPQGQPLPPLLIIGSTTMSKSWSVFGDMSYKLTDRLTLGAGVRSFRDRQDFLPGLQEGTFHSVDPRAYAQFKLTDQINAYASAAKGFRSGGVNTFTQESYDPESIWTYELGTKMALLGGRLRFDTALFHSDYTDYQTSGFSPTLGRIIIDNAGDARIRGIETDITWRATEQWTLSLNGNYLDTEFTRINLLSTAQNVGDPIDYVPKYQFTASVQRDFRLSGKPGFARLGYAEQGPETYRHRGIGPWFYNESDVIHLLDFKASLRWSNSLGLGFFAQNLLDDRGLTTPGSIEQNAVRSRPRTYGIEFDVAF